MNHTKIRNIAYFGGGALATVIIIVNLLNGIRLEMGEPFFTSFVPMIIQSLIIAVILYLPAGALRSRKTARPIALGYPILLALSLLMIIINGNSLQAQTIAGVVIMVTMIYCVLYAVMNWVRGRRNVEVSGE